MKAQIQRYAVALISLTVALISLGYNTWRNEQTEANRNIRAAGFEMILAMSDLHQVVFFSHYGNDDQLGDPKRGWAIILGLRDLSMVMPPRVQKAAAKLNDAWREKSGSLGSTETSVERINEAIDELRYEILMALEALG